MAKLKFSPRQNSKRDAFYMTGNLFDLDPTDSEPLPALGINPPVATLIWSPRFTPPLPIS